MADPHWTAYLTAFTVPAVAGLAAYIAFAQWRTARDKLRLDLFDRRLAVYQVLRDLLREFHLNQSFHQDDPHKVMSAFADAKWLFGDEVATYIHREFFIRMLGLRTAIKKINRSDGPCPTEEEYAKKTREWFDDQDVVLMQLFMPYLSFKHLKGDREWRLTKTLIDRLAKRT